jgi:hypothetical protein
MADCCYSACWPALASKVHQSDRRIEGCYQTKSVTFARTLKCRTELAFCNHSSSITSQSCSFDETNESVTQIRSLAQLSEVKTDDDDKHSAATRLWLLQLSTIRCTTTTTVTIVSTVSPFDTAGRSVWKNCCWRIIGNISDSTGRYAIFRHLDRNNLWQSRQSVAPRQLGLSRAFGTFCHGRFGRQSASLCATALSDRRRGGHF